MRIIRPALVIACAALLALALAASGAQAVPRLVAGLRVVASFNPAQGQNPENLVVAPDGTVYVTWLFAHAVVAVRPDGSQMAVSLPPGEATGIAIDPGPVSVIADEAHQGVENPSAVAFGPGRRLFITSAAYFGSHPALQVTRKPLDPGTRRASR